MKASKSRRCHNLEPGRIPWRKFSRQARFSCYLHRAPDKIHMWKLSAWGKISSHGKIKGRRISMVKKKKKEYHSIKKRKKPPVKATGTGGVQISNKEVASQTKFVILKVKNEFSFYFCKNLALVLLFKLAAAAKLKNHIRG